MFSSRFDTERQEMTTPFRRMLELMPEIARFALDRCATIQDSVEEPYEDKEKGIKHLPKDIIKVEKNILGRVSTRFYYY